LHKESKQKVDIKIVTNETTTREGDIKTIFGRKQINEVSMRVQIGTEEIDSAKTGGYKNLCEGRRRRRGGEGRE